MKVVIDGSGCISCGACVIWCPMSAIRLERGIARIEQERCVQCKKCIYKCYTRTIRVVEEAEDNQ